MKKSLLSIHFLLLILMLSSFAFVGTTNAQNSIPNGTFETWTSSTFDIPMYFPFTSNSESFFRQQTGAVNAVKSTPGYHGSYALQLTTTVSGMDTIFGYALNGNPNGNPNTWNGGMAYSQMSTGVRGYYKSNIMAGDSGLMIIAFSRSGTNIGSYVQTFGGNHSAFTLFTMNFSPPLSVTPDSVMIAYTSSNALANVQMAGSTVTFDSISFIAASQPAQMNGDFELWQSQTVMKPASWYFNGNGQATGMNRTTDAHSGSYAIELTTYYSNDKNGPQANSASIGTGWYPNCNGPCMEQGGYPYTKQTDTLAFWYKYVPMGNDSANVNVNFKKNGTQIGGNGMALHAAASYQYVELPFNLGTMPDSVTVDFQSSNWGDTALSYIGSDLKIDDVHFKSQGLTGVIDPNSLHTMIIYPNPMGTSATLEVDPQMNLEGVELRLTDVFGRIVKTIAVHESKTTIGKDDLSSGMYFYEVLNNSEILKTGKLIIE